MDSKHATAPRRSTLASIREALTAVADDLDVEQDDLEGLDFSRLGREWWVDGAQVRIDLARGGDADDYEAFNATDLQRGRTLTAVWLTYRTSEAFGGSDLGVGLLLENALERQPPSDDDGSDDDDADASADESDGEDEEELNGARAGGRARAFLPPSYRPSFNPVSGPPPPRPSCRASFNPVSGTRQCPSVGRARARLGGPSFNPVSGAWPCPSLGRARGRLGGSARCVNPWAVCHAQLGPARSAKFERCVMHVKAGQSRACAARNPFRGRARARPKKTKRKPRAHP